MIHDLRNDRELVNTRQKLRRLEARYDGLRRESGGDEHLRELTMHSLKRLMNQMTEEIVRYEIRRSVSVRTAAGLADAQARLAGLEAQDEELRRHSEGDERRWELSKWSLKLAINRLREQIAPYEARHPAQRQHERRTKTQPARHRGRPERARR